MASHSSGFANIVNMSSNNSVIYIMFYHNFIIYCHFNILLWIHDSRASDFGLMKIDNNGRIVSFSEKPKGKDLKEMVIIILTFIIILQRKPG